jgi:hypothetical protein
MEFIAMGLKVISDTSLSALFSNNSCIIYTWLCGVWGLTKKVKVGHINYKMSMWPTHYKRLSTWKDFAFQSTKVFFTHCGGDSTHRERAHSMQPSSEETKMPATESRCLSVHVFICNKATPWLQSLRDF